MFEKTEKTPVKMPSAKPMKFSGHTTVAIFENGKKVKEIQDDNMMTNELSRLFNLERLYSDQQSPYYSYRNNLPIWQHMLGGCLLYEQAIDEDPEITIAPINNTCVGHAGGEYTGGQPTRGTLNTPESGYIDPEDPAKGYRLVWDFSTDKANGQISCVCLTSRTGGNSGYGAGIDFSTDEQQNFFVANPTFLSENVSNPVQGFRFCLKNTKELLDRTTIRYLGKGKDGYDRITYLATVNKLILIEIASDTLELSISDETFNNYISYDFLKKDKLPPGCRITECELPFSVNKNLLANFVTGGKQYIVNEKSKTEFSFVVFDPDTKSFSEEQTRTVSPAYNNSGNNLCKVGDFWFGKSGSANTDVVRYPEAGGMGEVVGSSSAAWTALQEFNGGFLIFGNGASNAYFVKIFDPSEPEKYFAKTSSLQGGVGNYTQFLGSEQMGICLHSSITETTTSGTDSITISFSARTISGYVASINNLPSPVNKTSAQTMKITYEIRPKED